MTRTLFLLAVFFGTLTQAEPIKPPTVKPGPVQSVNDLGLSSLSVLAFLVKIGDDNTETFLSAGNEITAASVQQVKVHRTIYSYTIRHAHIDTSTGVGKKVYLGGALLRVVEDRLSGKDEKYETEVSLIKTKP